MSAETDRLEAEIRKLAAKVNGIHNKRKMAKTIEKQRELLAQAQALRPQQLALRAELSAIVRAEQAEAYRLAQERGDPEVIIGASNASASAGGD